MNEQPEDKAENQNDKLKTSEKESDESLWESDQVKRSYYYDDSTGYEIYNPDKEDEEDE